jgi:hypothetical protein
MFRFHGSFGIGRRSKETSKGTKGVGKGLLMFWTRAFQLRGIYKRSIYDLQMRNDLPFLLHQHTWSETSMVITH